MKQDLPHVMAAKKRTNTSSLETFKKSGYKGGVFMRFLRIFERMTKGNKIFYPFAIAFSDYLQYDDFRNMYRQGIAIYIL